MLWNNWNCYILPLGMQNDTATVENSMGVSYKVRYKLPMWPSNPTPIYLPKQNKSTYSHKHFYVNLHGRIIYNSIELALLQNGSKYLQYIYLTDDIFRIYKECL